MADYARPEGRRDDSAANTQAEPEGMPDKCWACDESHFELAGRFGYVCVDCGEAQRSL